MATTKTSDKKGTHESDGDKKAKSRTDRNGRQVSTDKETYEFKKYFDSYEPSELGLTDDDLVSMYRNMLLQRRFEERAAQMYGRQKIAGFLHLYIGQEAVSIGCVKALRETDYVITAYRDHGIALAMGMGANECMAELFGKIDGCSRGKGGSMHFFSAEKNFLGGHGIVGGQIPVGVGVAFAQKYKETDNVCICFFGDGAIQQGSFHEAANLAGLMNLPVVLVCENNMYGMGTSVERSSAMTDLYKRAASYDMHGVVADGMNTFAMVKAFQDVVALARKGEPSLLEVRTYRYRGHSMSDPAKYRTAEELESRKEKDSILQLKAYLLENEIIPIERLDEIDEEVKQEILDSVEFAENSPFPPLETIYDDIYVQEDYPFLTGPTAK
ncbi:MAG TPA: pyruvate dehydrogenase (acetyl-transferring) E1 component subunit alpha [Rhodothermia bacterium]|nr:pyruvate dehydrogenase (acetyl-transferring) E1 component subunit alpha [Rhodothermia bacterium]